MARQAQLDRAKLFVFLMLLVSRLCSVQRLLQQLRSLLAGQLGAFRSLTVSIQDPIRSTVQTEMQGREAASLPNGISEPPRHMRQGFPETGGNTRVKLGFVGVDRPEDPLYTGYPVQWMNKKDAKVAVFENDRQITQGDLSKLQIEILAVHAEFFTERGQADFTKEEFNKQICIHKGNESVLTTVNLVNGAAYIGSVIFTESSQRKRLRLTARAKGQDPAVRVQEAITDPFVVKVGRSKQNRKSYPPSKEEAVYRLEKISLKGKHCTLLAEKNITTVKQFMRHYYRDESCLQKLLDMKEDWSTLIKHATTSDPGVEIYSFIVVEENTELLFNDFYNLVGIMIRGRYFHVNVLDQFQQIKVNNWKMSAYKKFDERENSGGLNPDYFMTDGGPVSALPLNNDAGPSVQAGTLWQYHNGKAAQHEVGDRHPLNGLSRAAVLSNNDVGPSSQETLPFPQHMYEQTAYQGPGEHDPSVPQNGAPYSLHQGNILNDQGPLSAQPTIPSHNFSPVRQDDMIADASQSGFTSFDCLFLQVEEWLNLPIDEADHGIVPPNNGMQFRNFSTHGNDNEKPIIRTAEFQHPI
ncbi:calmodulin-binding protein 60 D-like isoform X1 [Hordeum vulgare subsp. vulgare]|uniref:calmodulin-binding protein 60 D-like isoform X1 n=1 Tax=Hordeum vulgare subsp. vulgare TaxID=112509 RepID=UPI001D1A3C2B|nr:calmodulin-binding protein 60 D-like isoform X1 [Hordeum vulgare subsp. vulgare]